MSDELAHISEWMQKTRPDKGGPMVLGQGQCERICGANPDGVTENQALRKIILGAFLLFTQKICANPFMTYQPCIFPNFAFEYVFS